MGAIRYKHNQGNVVLNQDGVLDGFGVSSDTIPALMRDGSEKFKRFGGFVNNIELLHVQRVKIVRIMAWTSDEAGITDWQLLPADHYVEGVYLHDMYYIRLFDGQLKHHPMKQPMT